jgi:serine phosphatase RsbU (regulator of sigma subunit)/ligand-binding sensor domain-containing protein
MNNNLNYVFKYAILLIVILTSTSFAQLNPNNIVQFTEKDGVPGSQVSKVLIDKFGYVWIGTINGLARYDGYEFKRFYNDPNDSTSIKGLIIWSLFEDSKGRIWIASSPEILNVYDQVTKSFKQYEFKHLIERQTNVEIGIAKICEDDKGRLYFGIRALYDETISSSLLYFDEKENKVKKFPLPDSLIVQNVYNLINDKNGNIYISSATGFFKIDPDRKISRVEVPLKELENKNEFIMDFNIDNDGHIWFITNKSRLIDYDPQSEEYKIFYQHESDKSSYDELIGTTIVFDKDDNLWIGTNKGIFFFNKEKKSFENFSDPSINPIKNEIILDLKLDSFGTLWIGTQFGGLFKYEERTLFNSYRFTSSDKNSLTPGWANNIYEAHDGKIWITTSGQGNSSGINFFDIKKRLIESIPFQNFLPGSYVIFGLIEISPGEFLISTETGVYTFYPETKKVNRIELKGVPNSIFIHDFLKDKYENLWLCSFDELYKKSKGDDVFKRYDLSQLQGSNEITGALESKKHGLWLLTTNGLFSYNYKTDKIERHGFDKTKGDVFGTQDINSIYEDSKGTIWVGTWQGGLSKYNVETKKIKTYTRNDGLPSMSIQGILEDEDKDALWLSTFEGLSFFNIRTEKFNNFSIADGIQSQLFAEGACLKTSQGLFIFGGANGISVFGSNDVNNNSIPPKVFLTDLKLFNNSIIPGDNSILEKPIYETKEIILAHDQNNISLEFTALHYSNPSKNKTLYRLKNFENVWRDAGSQHSAFYPNLPPGEYLFQVKAANNNGVWNEEGVSLKIIIKPPWWKTTWAYASYFVLFLAGGFSLDRYQRFRIKSIEQRRAQLALLRAENQRKTQELEEARQLQLSMLPKVLPQLPHLDIAVYMKTATEVGGDYYDFNVSLDGTLTVVLGDATGHGMRAGTMVTSTKSLFNSYAANPDILFTFREMTRCIKQMQFQSLAMSMLMLKIKNCKLLMSSAGMPPVYLFRNKHKMIEEYLIEGMPLGTMDNFPYELKEMELFSGDTILLMSDGLPELFNKEKEMFGYERVMEIYKNSASKNPEEIIEELKNEGNRWTNNEAPDDDVTFVVIKVK